MSVPLRSAVFSLLLCMATLSARGQAPDAARAIAAQRAAMAKLSFLVGKWSGPIAISRGPGEPMHMTQTEDVQRKLDGLILLIEGTSRDGDGKVRFQALATVSYDDVEKKYHFRAYNDGRYLDTELAVPDKGFSWGFEAGPVHVINTMHLTDKGEWAEQTESVYGQQPPRSTMDMTLTKQP